MILRDLHTHTTFSDGESTPEQMVLSAIGKGLATIGFSDHSYTAFDLSYCMTEVEGYIAEITRLKEKYRGKIEILLGIEQDFYSNSATDRFDYVIGSAHYIKTEESYIPIDESADILKRAAAEHFDGDIYALAEEYYRTVSGFAERADIDIIGHFDLISKFNENGSLFDESHPRYIAAYKDAVDRLIKLNKPFEINTGAISRGYKTVPYPAAKIKEYITSKGGAFILSSDSHCADTLCFDFDKYK